jgi:diaminopimelate epimerase
MAEIEFHKLHGAGNDFVLIDARGKPFTLEPRLASRLANRQTGVGCDQVLVLRDAAQASRARYEIFNADGSPAGQCGNGARCIALYLDRCDGPEEQFSLESPSGVVAVRRLADDYEIDMGVPVFDPASIPYAGQDAEDPYRVESPWGELEFGAVSMGNPHALIVVEDLQNPQIPRIAAYLGGRDLFPEGVNVGFAQVQGEDRIELRVIERGVGETLACGSGACAAVAILRRRGQVGERVEVDLPGGRLVIKWRGEDAPLLMAGPAQHVFKGTMNE